MLGSLSSLLSRYIGFYEGYVVLQWKFLALLFVVRIVVFVISSDVRNARRNRLREINRERENLRERLRLVGDQLREMDRSLQPVLTLAEQGAGPLAGEGQAGIPRLRLNDDGSITEYS